MPTISKAVSTDLVFYVKFKTSSDLTQQFTG